MQSQAPVDGSDENDLSLAFGQSSDSPSVSSASRDCPGFVTSSSLTANLPSRSLGSHQAIDVGDVHSGLFAEHHPIVVQGNDADSDDSNVPLAAPEYLERDAYGAMDLDSGSDDSDAPLAPLEHLEREIEGGSAESDDDSDGPLAPLEHLEREIDGGSAESDDDSDGPLAPLEPLEREMDDRSVQSDGDSDAPLAPLEHLEREIDGGSAESDDDSDGPLAPLEPLEREMDGCSVQSDGGSDASWAPLQHLRRPGSGRRVSDGNELDDDRDGAHGLMAPVHVKRDTVAYPRNAVPQTGNMTLKGQDPPKARRSRDPAPPSHIAAKGKGKMLSAQIPPDLHSDVEAVESDEEDLVGGRVSAEFYFRTFLT
ncbi:hypothetical protein PENSPDRAFT_662515 [Peniophora sp. CONT]|nr:hypothetical protein PENSPDRAFT_662515 [Peniophora sp. CONT]